MAKASTTTVCTRTASKKKKDSAADKLQKQVALEKKQKKKQRASEKRAEEDKKKKTDQEKADANMGTVTVLPPNNNEVIVTIGLDDEEEMEINFEYTQAENEDWTNTEDADALARHGISPTHLFGKGHEESTEALPRQSKTPREQHRREHHCRLNSGGELSRQEDIQEGGGTKWHEGKQPLHHQ
jgi:hypothetical protein